MIVTAVGLLVLAVILLIVGIIKSSAGMLGVSFFATVVSMLVLYASFLVYRAKALEEGTATADDVAIRPGWPLSYGRGAAATNGHQPDATVVAAAPAARGVPAGWDDLTAAEASKLVGAFGLDELHDLRRHEVEHAGRKTVLNAIDKRIDSIVGVRKQLEQQA